MKRVLACLLLLSVLVGCRASYEKTSSAESGDAARIPANASVYVGMSPDGRYGETVYFGSGSITTQTLVTALAAALDKVGHSETILDRETGLAQTRAGSFDYYLEPKILHWEDRNTVWSARPDAISVEVTLLDAATGAEIDTTTIKGTSKIFAFSDSRPRDLLLAPMRDYAAELVR